MPPSASAFACGQLYSYVSRGLVRTRPDESNPRAHFCAAADIDALAKRRARAKRPAAAAAGALDWGLPVLETRLSSIEAGTLRFRGRDAIELAETATLEEVAALLWATPVAAFPGQPGALPIPAAPRVTDRAIARLAALLPDDAPGITGTAAASRAAAYVRQVGEAAAGVRLPGGPMHVALARAWRRPDAADPIRRALVLSADHELNASSFAVRVVASTGASLVNALVAGLAAMSGPVHGGASERVEAFLDEAGHAVTPAAAVTARLGRGETIPGFGHFLYQDGDPRAAAIPGGRRGRRGAAPAEGDRDGHRPKAQCRFRAGSDGAEPCPAARRRAGALYDRPFGRLDRPRLRAAGDRPTDPAAGALCRVMSGAGRVQPFVIGPDGSGVANNRHRRG